MHRRQSSIDYSSAKKIKYYLLSDDANYRVERPGNNAYGSKGTYRCLKCQKRKGKVLGL
jgi:hypothetical protein